MSFLKSFTYLFANDLQRTFLDLLDDNKDAFLDESSYFKFVEMLSEINPRFSKTDALKSFLRSTKNQTVWTGALKHLMILHKLIHDFGHECYQLASSEELSHFQSFRSQEPSLCKCSSFFFFSNSFLTSKTNPII